MTTLFYYASEQNVTLANALKDCGAALQSPKTHALLYAPNWLKFGLLDGDAVPRDANGDPINLDPVYEARVFNQDAELRWLN
ncbi:MAG: type III-D CRISPR-associated protein Csx19, partial [Blastocatellia bacterium]